MIKDRALVVKMQFFEYTIGLFWLKIGLFWFKIGLFWFKMQLFMSGFVGR